MGDSDFSKYFVPYDDVRAAVGALRRASDSIHHTMLLANASAYGMPNLVAGAQRWGESWETAIRYLREELDNVASTTADCVGAYEESDAFVGDVMMRCIEVGEL